jgi:hypothetical protein
VTLRIFVVVGATDAAANVYGREKFVVANVHELEHCQVRVGQLHQSVKRGASVVVEWVSHD